MGSLEAHTQRLSATEAVIRVSGEVDLATVPELEAAFEEARGAGVAAIYVDLADCSFIDSTGVAVLIRCSELSPPRRGTNADGPDGAPDPSASIRFFGAAGEVRRLFEIVKLGDLLPLFASLEQARG